MPNGLGGVGVVPNGLGGVGVPSFAVRLETVVLS